MRKTGIYFLIRSKKIVYIGQTTNWPLRPCTHTRIDFDSIHLFECSASDLDRFERRAIEHFRPKENINFAMPRRLKLTDTWVLAHQNEILEGIRQGGRKFEFTSKARALAEKARVELGYGPRTASTDIWTTMHNRLKTIQDGGKTYGQQPKTQLVTA